MNSLRDPDQFNIVLGIDSSDHSKAAVEMIAKLSAPKENLVHAIAVLPPRQSDLHTNLQASLLEAQANLETQGWLVEPKLVSGSPAESIIQLADEKNASLIVVGAVGLRATFRFLLGGVA